MALLIELDSWEALKDDRERGERLGPHGFDLFAFLQGHSSSREALLPSPVFSRL